MDDRLTSEVEIFADLMARLDDPFNDRVVVLAGSGLDDERLRALVESWRIRLEHGASGSLTNGFVQAYSARRTALADLRRRAASAETAPVDARFLNADAQSFREDAAMVARDPVDAARAVTPALGPLSAPSPAPVASMSGAASSTPSPWAGQGSSSGMSAPPFRPPVLRPPEDLDATGEISAFVPRHLLPFVPAAASTAAAPASTPAPPARPPRSLEVGATPAIDATGEFSAFVPRHLLPFVPAAASTAAASTAAASTAAAPRRRLMRFDPQTGQPLPSPIWVDLPPEPEGQK